MNDDLKRVTAVKQIIMAYYPDCEFTTRDIVRYCLFDWDEDIEPVLQQYVKEGFLMWTGTTYYTMTHGIDRENIDPLQLVYEAVG
jgi:hypothetical protein